jgi:hypothetical protein
VRVVRRGVDPSIWNNEFDCQKCDSLIEVEKSDLTFVADQRDGNAYTFTCPVCKHVNWLDASLVPS